MNNIDEIYHNLSPDELWALGKNTPESELNWSKEEHQEFEKLCLLQDQTGLEFDILRTILNKPQEASMSDIIQYCQSLNIDKQIFLDEILKKLKPIDMATAA